jgi:hypothetical protein
MQVRFVAVIDAVDVPPNSFELVFSCRQIFSVKNGPGGGSTTNLRNHLERYHKALWKPELEEGPKGLDFWLKQEKVVVSVCYALYYCPFAKRILTVKFFPEPLFSGKCKETSGRMDHTR